MWAFFGQTVDLSLQQGWRATEPTNDGELVQHRQSAHIRPMYKTLHIDKCPSLEMPQDRGPKMTTGPNRKLVKLLVGANAPNKIDLGHVDWLEVDLVAYMQM
jgi:hypothetical protein